MLIVITKLLIFKNQKNNAKKSLIAKQPYTENNK